MEIFQIKFYNLYPKITPRSYNNGNVIFYVYAQLPFTTVIYYI